MVLLKHTANEWLIAMDAGVYRVYKDDNLYYIEWFCEHAKRRIVGPFDFELLALNALYRVDLRQKERLSLHVRTKNGLCVEEDDND